MSISVKKVRYGYILINSDGFTAEPLTRYLNVPYYKSAEAAQKQADKLNSKPPEQS